MKVVHLSQYAYFPFVDTFNKNNSGLGYMIADITRSLAKNNVEIWLLTHSGITNQRQIDGVNLFRKKKVDIVTSITPNSIVNGIKMAINANISLKKSLRVIGYSVVANYAKKCINSIQPDIVHIHGLGFAGMAFIEMCERNKINYVITLHGLIGLDEKVEATKFEKNFEKKLLLHCENMKIPVTVISTGIKKRIVSNYMLNSSRNIQVVQNGTDILNYTGEKINVREKYNIPKDAKVLITIGHVSENKNQIQLIRAYYRLPEDYQRDVYILILGNDSNNLIYKELSKYENRRNIIYCGTVPKNELSSYISEANLNIFLSLNDGFGLSMIETMAFGVPTVTFKDLDAIPDIYDNKAFFLFEDRSDEMVAKGIVKSLSVEWDREYIMNNYSKFDLDSMANKYIQVYKSMMGDVNDR